MVLWSAEDTGEDAAVAATYTIDSNAMSDGTQGPRMITHFTYYNVSTQYIGVEFITLYL